MTNAELDRAIELENERIWEEMNHPTMENPYLKYSFDDLNGAWAKVETSDLGFESIEKYLGGAMEKMEGTPIGDRLSSIYDAICDLRIEAAKINKELKAEGSKAFDREWKK